jgi:hypothetical protein
VRMSYISDSSLNPLCHSKMSGLLLAWLFLNSFPLLLVSSRSRPSTHSIRARGARSLTHQRPLCSLGHTAKCRRFVFAPACRGIMSKRGNIKHTPPNKLIEEQPMISWGRIDEFYLDDLDSAEVEDNMDMEDAFRFTRETYLGRKTSQPSYHLNFQQRWHF